MMPIFGLAPPEVMMRLSLLALHESQHGVALEIVQPRFLAEEGVVQADVEAARRHHEIGRRHDLNAVERAVDHRGRLHRLVHAFERGPGAAEARHRPAVEPIVEKSPARRPD